MKRSLLFFLPWFLLPVFASAQLVDDFSDGDLLNPDWLGNTDRFTVENGELRLVDATANTTLLYLPAATSLAAPTTYEWLIRLDFSPSGGNFARIYLSEAPLVDADQAVGYYLQVGGVSDTVDALKLYRQDADGAETLLISGTAGAVGGSVALARVRLERTTVGTWLLSADYTGGTDYESQGSAEDATYDVLRYFGLYYRYTTTRSDAFYFDDLSVDPIYIDSELPVLESAAAESATSVRVNFSEPIDPTSLSTAGFSLDNGIGAPVSVQPAAGDPTAVILSLGTALSSFITYTLSASGVADLSGNVMAPATTTFPFVIAQVPVAGDLILTEFMADPSPEVALPDAEYVELYNRSEAALQLRDVGLASGGTPQLLPDFVLLPGEYVVVTDMDDVAAFGVDLPVIGVPSFPTLSNGGDIIELYTPLGEELFLLNYTDDWYRDISRSEGGYSLELSDVTGAADCEGLWAASQSPRGGTPGEANSLAEQILDNVAPQLQTAFFDGNRLVLRFNEQLQPATVVFRLSPDLGVAGTALENNARDWVLFLTAAPQNGTVYELILPASISDCAGNPLGEERTIRLGLPEPTAPGDLIINEILFNPEVGGVDFVELFNCSAKVVDLRGLQISNEQLPSGNIRQTIGSNYLLLPSEYVAVVENDAKLRGDYTVGPLLENALPTLPPDAGNVTLTNLQGDVLDAVDYSADWHSDLLDTDRGVSLERINAKGDSQDRNNWFSAASTVGDATPGLPNSQVRNNVDPIDDFFRLREDLLSPDGDGYQDFLQIDYETPGPGWTLRWTIFNESGQSVRVFPRTELLAGSGSLVWDGATDDQQRARSGIYVALLNLFNPADGERREKLVFAIAY